MPSNTRPLIPWRWALLVMGIAGFCHADKQRRPCVEVFAELSAHGLHPLFHRGKELTEAEVAAALGFLKIKTGTPVSRLGGGNSADVYRVGSPSKKTYVVKVFHGKGAQTAQDAYRDSIQGLREMRAANKHEPTDTLEVVAIEKEYPDQNTLKLADTRGYALDEIAEVLKKSAPEKYAKIAKEYNRRLTNFMADLKDAGFITQYTKVDMNSHITYDSSHVSFDSYEGVLPNGQKLDLGLIFQVVFEPETGRFVIIDPY